ncbi:hypothetical protein HGI30_05975 [Paenibacillus albicereus]|uniref:ATP-dependent DNA ligase family profile domain-containing protein n=1 Tax=Paenibacillus albicereus TaxID=2726185 RepID=A0A6H2GUS5_9BACL|nr:hypothetical protein [Paenibacillus albicereus]QJC51157.1 hypothetical protein HGI30_05975 [Paenibacillus albicereus]
MGRMKEAGRKDRPREAAMGKDRDDVAMGQTGEASHRSASAGGGTKKAVPPMAPLPAARLPEGPDWGYQIKWDGVRLIATIGGDGAIELVSRNGLPKNAVYPELVALLRSAAPALGPSVLDGELIAWTGERPSFQRVLQRERMRGRSAGSAMASLRHPDPGVCPWRIGAEEVAADAAEARDVSKGRKHADPHPDHHQPAGSDGHSEPLGPPGLAFILFDVLAHGGHDLRALPYASRHRRLLELAPLLPSGMLVTELYRDGAALWRWVQEQGWEGVVSKRLTAPYRAAKTHRDWFKTKTALRLDVDIVGLKVREGQAASLVMSLEGQYFGSVSLGLTGEMRALLTKQLVPEEAFQEGRRQHGELPFAALPSDLKGERVVWLEAPLPCTVTGLEVTEAGQLRHPKLAGFGRRTS